MVKFVENPCLCMNLKVGALIIALFELVLSLSLASFGTVIITQLAIVHSGHDEDEMRNVASKLAFVAYGDNVETMYGTTKVPMLEQYGPEVVFAELYIILSLTVLRATLETIFSTLLVIGIKNERLKFLKFWILFKFACLTLQYLIIITSLSLNRNVLNETSEMVNLLLCFIGSYFLYVIYRLYNRLLNVRINSIRVKPRSDAIRIPPPNSNV